MLVRTFTIALFIHYGPISWRSVCLTRVWNPTCSTTSRWSHSSNNRSLGKIVIFLEFSDCQFCTRFPMLCTWTLTTSRSWMLNTVWTSSPHRRRNIPRALMKGARILHQLVMWLPSWALLLGLWLLPPRKSSRICRTLPLHCFQNGFMLTGASVLVCCCWRYSFISLQSRRRQTHSASIKSWAKCIAQEWPLRWLLPSLGDGYPLRGRNT